jgi:hypothetical protein
MPKALSRKQVSEIESLIADTHLSFLAELAGEDALTEEERQRLEARGMLRHGVNLLKRAYQYGLLAGNMNEERPISPGEFTAFLNSSASVLSAEDQRIIDEITEHFTTHVKGISLDFQHRFQLALADADKHLRRVRHAIVRQVVSEGAAHGDSVREIALKLRKAIGDSKRDWLRVAATELHNFVQEGKASAFLRRAQEGGHDEVRVFKRPRPDACAYCKLLYLEADGITPRIFRLVDLIANGNNAGRKANRPTLSGPLATEWKATLDAVHPFCQCELHEIPEGYAFENGKMKFVGLKKAVAEDLSPLDRLLLNHRCEK